jgi:hypothetical protein
MKTRERHDKNDKFREGVTFFMSLSGGSVLQSLIYLLISTLGDYRETMSLPIWSNRAALRN